jgi:hypothetical protein
MICKLLPVLKDNALVPLTMIGARKVRLKIRPDQAPVNDLRFIKAGAK